MWRTLCHQSRISSANGLSAAMKACAAMEVCAVLVAWWRIGWCHAASYRFAWASNVASRAALHVTPRVASRVVLRVASCDSMPVVMICATLHRTRPLRPPLELSPV